LRHEAAELRDDRILGGFSTEGEAMAIAIGKTGPIDVTCIERNLRASAQCIIFDKSNDGVPEKLRNFGKRSRAFDLSKRSTSRSRGLSVTADHGVLLTA